MGRRKTTEEFINDAKQIYGEKYDYSKVDYVNNKTKVCIICQEHGEFWQRPNDHLDGSQCPLCNGTLKKDTDLFISECKNIHKGKYDYSKVNYIDSKTKICIICHKHGEFWQTPNSHIQGHGCPKCYGNGKGDVNHFIEKAINKHGNKYNYSKVKYVNSHTKVCIICPTHGEFWQTPILHLKSQGCPKCYGNYNYTKNDFIKKANNIHNCKYDYSKVEYVNSRTKVCIICPEHGEFWQTPSSHLNGRGCPICKRNFIGEYHRSDVQSFINKSIIKHGIKYDYSKVNYVNTHTKVCIICPEHGEFWQTPSDHLQGHGCNKCICSNAENEIRNLLTENHIHFEEQKKFDWLGRQSLDFYLPDHNIAIECQGIQHFEPIEYFGGPKKLEYVKQKDNVKKQLCEEHNIKILYYVNYDYDFPYEVFTDKNKLINEIIWKKK